jgi:hypothetical protein
MYICVVKRLAAMWSIRYLGVAGMLLASGGRILSQATIEGVASSQAVVFATTAIGSSSAGQAIEVTLTQAVSISSVSVPASVGGKQEFTVGAVKGCTVDGATVYPAGTLCIVNVTFKPGYPGERRAPLIFATSGGSMLFGLAGVGTGPMASVSPGTISTVAGGGTTAPAGGPATGAQLGGSPAVAVDNAGNFYVASNGNFSSQVFRVDAATGDITLYAGTPRYYTYGGDGGPAVDANLVAVSGMALDSAGNLYLSDGDFSGVREVNASTGIITTVAGIPTNDYYSNGYTGDMGPASLATLSAPQGLAVDTAGNLFIADTGNSVIREISASTGNISTVVGTVPGYSGDGGPGAAAELSSPQGVAIDAAGNLYIADTGNNCVRRVDAVTGNISTVAGTGVEGDSADGAAATSTNLDEPVNVAVDAAGNLYLSEVGYNAEDSSGPIVSGRVREVLAATGTILTVAGNGRNVTPHVGFAANGDGGAATGVELLPGGVALDAAGNLYVSDIVTSSVRRVSASAATLVYPACTQNCTSSTVYKNSFNLIASGNAALSVSAPASGSNPAIPAGWPLDSASTCGVVTAGNAAKSLAPGAICTYVVDDNAATTPAGNASVDVSDNSLTVPATQTVALIQSAVSASTTSIVLSTLTNSCTTGLNPVCTTYCDYSFACPVEIVVTSTFTGALSPPVNGTVVLTDSGTVVGTGIQVTNGVGSSSFTATSPGVHSITGVFTPSSGSIYASSTSAVFALTEYKAVPKYDIDGAPVQYDGNPHGVTLTTVPAGLPYTITYEYPDNTSTSAPPTAAGVYYYFPRINTTDYTLDGIDGAFQITPAPATITLGNLSVAYDGNPHAVSATTSPAGLGVYITYDGSATAPSAKGAHQVVANITDANYMGTATGILLIGVQAATISLGNLTATYDGNPHGASVTTSPAGLATTVTYNGSTAVPTEGGTYTVAASINGTSYAGFASGTLVINPETVTITLSNLTVPYNGMYQFPTDTVTPNVPAYDVYTQVNGGYSILPFDPGTYAVTQGVYSNDYISAPVTVNFTITAPTDSPGTIFIVNGNSTVESLFETGALKAAQATGGGTGAAIDADSSVWSFAYQPNLLQVFSNQITPSITTIESALIQASTALAIDGLGTVWLTNQQTNAGYNDIPGGLAAVTPAGALAYGSTLEAGSLDYPSSISVDSAGSLWIANSGSNNVVEVIGVAAPVATPVLTQLTTKSEGKRP